MMIHYKKLQQPHFDNVKKRLKKVEGRIDGDKMKKIKVGDHVVFTEPKTGQKVTIIVIELNHYDSFKNMLEMESLENTLPNAITIQDGLDVYLEPNGFFKKDDEHKYGVLAMKMELV